MIDMHSHLDLYPNPGRVIAEAEKRGVFVLAVTTTPRAFLGNVRLTEGRKRIRVAVGLHPELVATRHREVDDVCKFMAQTKYVGEVGLDGSPDHIASLPLQREVFTDIVQRAEDHGGRILSIHSRGAATAVLDVLGASISKSLPILHWFSGSMKELDRAIELGCWFSVGPAMLRGRKGRELAAAMPRERILTETDGPFAMDGSMALMPWDAERGLPVIAESWECTSSEADRQLHENLRNLLGKFDQAQAA
ncbi:TatD family hydrolase (plasmid) [Rhizobium leguminosarum]|uniref:Qat anti-phage system TatD family nuclease QatD n=1 Tax=Rhizobium leguminosarum TaxID=384 RepID=UPI001A918AF3|nr:Qat anti-phage system TatD family nuclease QatD [Rhizobium leguminosarum]MBY5558100.1 TatD family hydrolase [Rhizobium leguminosarum]QSW27885.1 TatD family hydrolase [Rhizobium leguminosarum]